MTHLGLVVFSFVFSLVSSVTTQIEGAFIHNDADGLKGLLAPGSFLTVSLSGPVAFSDVLSDEQTILWFRKFFRSAKTLGFYPENASPSGFDRGSFIFKARWEVQTGERKPVAYDVLFLIWNGRSDQIRRGFAEDDRRANANGSRRGSRKGHHPGSARDSGIWTILQIRADER
ncbi:MAG: hypothetical protein ACYDH3_03515 [Candidatus Aminicenantales bacterium]